MKPALVIDDAQMGAVQRLGLSEYETRSYLALVKMGPAKASELSFFAQVPRTKTYGVVRELERKGLIRVIPGKPELYSAVSPDETLVPLLINLQSKLKDSEETVHQLSLTHEANRFVRRDVPHESSEFWEIEGRPSLFNKMNGLLLDTKRSICYATSAAGLIRLYKVQADILDRAKERGVRVRILAPMSPENMVVAEQLAEIVELRKIDRPFGTSFVSVDSEQLIVVDSRPDDMRVDVGSDAAIWTINKLLVDLYEQLFERVWNYFPQLEARASDETF